MNKIIINRIIELRSEIEELPSVLLSEENLNAYLSSNSDEDRNKVEAEIRKITDRKDKVIRKIVGFFSAQLEDDSTYYTQLANIKFTPKEGIYNTIHYRNNQAWSSGREQLLNLFEILENEMRERINQPKSDRKQNIFSSGLFWTVLPIVAGFSYFLGTYKAEFDKTEIQKELSASNKENKDLKEVNNRLNLENDSLINQRK
ncbi:hypothetical protein HS960_09795 [Sphingobacterium paramultivorum]|uniref:Uncharacterized protein n=1 Tax=Sphingobacterium paramultivorum TaxID=2886510 RepID=A0A7G5E1Q5_9SPHI|nr:hypothetical protein [Sphingobacterium paramultivorum]QMV67930.1 hypothetical protein HS960_09795 [Sphingobacterium paramultivorum]WSO16830.1 hypothetical protein VUL84_09785 [Sphingobacterium paramultivorum]